jgi:Rrf2 family iron-sulfur cluster assembly transcriptional regulator
MTHDLWASLNERIVDFLDSVSLQDLVDQQQPQSQSQLREQNVVVVQRAIAAA